MYAMLVFLDLLITYLHCLSEQNFDYYVLFGERQINFEDIDFLLSKAIFLHISKKLWKRLMSLEPVFRVVAWGEQGHVLYTRLAPTNLL